MGKRIRRIVSEGLVYEICAVLLRSASHDQSKTVVILGILEAEKMFPQIKLMSFFSSNMQIDLPRSSLHVPPRKYTFV